VVPLLLHANLPNLLNLQLKRVKRESGAIDWSDDCKHQPRSSQDLKRPNTAAKQAQSRLQQESQEGHLVELLLC
jgi:hypothetical protein